MNEEKLSEIMDKMMESISGYELENAIVAQYANGDIVERTFWEDIYDGLENFQKVDGAEAVIVDTSGKARPLGDNGEPDYDADPYRVRLIAIYDGNKLFSAMEFSHNKERVFDENEATGSLADAMKEAWGA